MLTDEWLQENAARINKVVNYAETKGDVGAVLGSLILWISDEEEFDRIFHNLDESAVNPIVDRMRAAGVVVDG